MSSILYLTQLHIFKNIKRKTIRHNVLSEFEAGWGVEGAEMVYALWQGREGVIGCLFILLL